MVVHAIGALDEVVVYSFPFRAFDLLITEWSNVEPLLLWTHVDDAHVDDALTGSHTIGGWRGSKPGANGGTAGVWRAVLGFGARAWNVANPNRCSGLRSCLGHVSSPALMMVSSCLALHLSDLTCAGLA